MVNKLKRILAMTTVVVIVLFIIATFVIACLDFPNKQAVLTSCILGTIFLPIMAWIFLWMHSIITRKKNIASFRSAEMEEIMQKADEIKAQQDSKE